MKQEIGRVRVDNQHAKAQFRAALKSVRTSVVLVCSACVVCFLLLPLALDRLSHANASHADAASASSVFASSTPLPASTVAVPEGARTVVTAAENPDAVHISKYTVLTQNDDYETVRALQLRLMELGYLDFDEPTTVYGASTAAAVSLFQRTLEREPDGIADIETQERLFSRDAVSYEMKLGDSGADVRNVQTRLFELGYYTEKISGFYGVATESAVRAFQTKHKIASDGVFRTSDSNILFSLSAKPFIDPTPTPSPVPTPKRRTASPTKTPSSSSGSSGSSSGSSGSSGGSFSASHSASGIVSVAKAQTGKSYVRGEEGPNTFDCSGLVCYSLRTCGFSCSRLTANAYSKNGSWTKIESISDLRAGDLVFFCDDDGREVNHAGVFIGGGRFVHASASKGCVVTSSISGAYWTRNFICGRRVA